MYMINFFHFYGTVTMINDYITNDSEVEGCNKLMTVTMVTDQQSIL